MRRHGHVEEIQFQHTVRILAARATCVQVFCIEEVMGDGGGMNRAHPMCLDSQASEE
jgi:hypothetical protein